MEIIFRVQPLPPENNFSLAAGKWPVFLRKGVSGKPGAILQGRVAAEKVLTGVREWQGHR